MIGRCKLHGGQAAGHRAPAGAASAGSHIGAHPGGGPTALHHGRLHHQGAQIAGNGVVAAAVNDSRPAGQGDVVGAIDALADEGHLAGEVAVAHAGLGAGAHQGQAVVQVGAHRGADHPGGAGHHARQAVVVGAVGLDEGEVEPRVQGLQGRSQPLEAGQAATRQGPAQVGGPAAGEVVGHQLAGEASGTKEDDVEVGHGRSGAAGPLPSLRLGLG